jgi:tetratricopeptide (TPR) repeat protein
LIIVNFLNTIKKPFCKVCLHTSKILSSILLVASLLSSFLPEIQAQDLNKLAYQARVNLYDKWDYTKAAYYFDKVIGKRGAPATAYSDYGWYLMLIDKYQEGLTYIQKAAIMDPKDKQLVTWNSWALLWDGNLPKAKEWINKALKIDPDYGEALYVGSMIASEMKDHQESLNLANKAAASDANWRGAIPHALAKAGKQKEALQWAEKIGKNANAFDAILLVQAYALLGKDDLSLVFLHKAYELKHPFMPWLKFIPSIRHLHNDPEFLNVVDKMKLPK